MFNQLKPLAALIATALISTSALATNQTLYASNYSITYDDSDLVKFGALTSTASGVAFAPSGEGFSVESFGGPKTSSSIVALTITANTGYTLTGFNLSEYGSYLKFGAGSQVSAGGNLTVQDLNSGNNISKQLAVSAPLTNSTTFENLVSSSWSAGTSAQVATTKATVSIYNILGAWAVSANDGYATIGKSNVVLDVNVAAVPEPQSLAMLLAGLGIVGAVARRRRIGA